MNYYNEFDPQAAQWLRNLIAAGLIPLGDVDERSIEDVIPNDLRGYTQCHFFAGIAGWSLALDLAGWPRDRPVWTGSCPCQPFSAAGKGDGFADQRHLWPAWFHLIRQCKPNVVFGEQVASAIRHGWLDLVSADMEAEGYAIGAAVLGAHSVGAPHIRQRLYWMADASGARSFPGAFAGVHRGEEVAGTRHVELERHCQLGDASNPRSQGHGRPVGLNDQEGRQGQERHLAAPGVRVVGESNRAGSLARNSAAEAAGHGGSVKPAGFWAGAEWIKCQDGKLRPIEPGTSPLASGIPARVVRLRAYGNSIVPQSAAAFIRATMSETGAMELAA